MIRKASLMVLVAGSIGLAAGCGSSSSTTTTTTSASPSAASTSSASSGAGKAAVAQAVAKCKSVVNSRATLSASLKSKLIGICHKAGSGNSAGVKQILGQVCTQIVNSTVPSAAPKGLKEQALKECKKAFA